MMHPNYSGFYNAAENSWRYYVDNAGNSYQPGSASIVGTVTGGNLTTANLTTTGTAQFNTVVLENTACASNGLVARDAVGLLLSCQSSVWKPAQSTSVHTYTLAGYNTGNTGLRTNSTTSTQFVSAYGGSSVSPTYNSSNMTAYVNGSAVQTFNDGGAAGSKATFMSFPVPPGGTWRITSSPYPYGNGAITWNVYTM